MAEPTQEDRQEYAKTELGPLLVDLAAAAVEKMPEDPLEFIRQWASVRVAGRSNVEVEAMLDENQELRRKLDERDRPKIPVVKELPAFDAPAAPPMLSAVQNPGLKGAKSGSLVATLKPKVVGPEAALQADIARLEDIFNMIDVDRSNTVTKIELIKAVRQMPDVAKFFDLPTQIRQEDGSRDLFEEMFQKIDQDGNREVTWEEFLTFYKTEVLGEKDKVAIGDGRRYLQAEIVNLPSKPQAALDNKPANRAKGPRRTLTMVFRRRSARPGMEESVWSEQGRRNVGTANASAKGLH